MMSAPELSRGTGPDPSRPSHLHPGESPSVERSDQPGSDQPRSDLPGSHQPRSDRPHSDEPRSAAVIAGDAFAAYRSGDSNRLNELVSVTTPILWHTVRSYRLDSAAAEDVLQSAHRTLTPTSRRYAGFDEPVAIGREERLDRRVRFADLLSARLWADQSNFPADPRARRRDATHRRWRSGYAGGRSSARRDRAARAVI